MPPIVTKDGVTVFRNIGFSDATQQVVMEVARSAAVRTASEAGDGTTTATILAHSLVSEISRYCQENPMVSPQKIVRELSKRQTIIEELIKSMRVEVDFDSPDGRKKLLKVAEVSANGDTELAEAVMACFDYSGPDGNVTLSEANGPSKYHIEKIDGYPIPGGFEDSCGPFYQKFVNDRGTQSCVLERPSVILHHGRINDFNSLFPVLAQIANAVSTGEALDSHKLTHNVIVVATGFSETVLANLAAGFVQEGTLNVYPLVAPMSPVKTGQYDFLADLASLTGANIMDPIERPLQNFQLEDLGVGPSLFEATRFRSNLIGNRMEELVIERVEQVTQQLAEVAVSELEKTLLRERVAKLTSGIARLVIQAPSPGEIKEKRDRAEDAVAAVRGAIRHGILKGGGFTLANLVRYFQLNADSGSGEILFKALIRPVQILYANAGFDKDSASIIIEQMVDKAVPFNILAGEWATEETMFYDSVPAVLESIRSAISIATLLGTCGGTIVFIRDSELDRAEAKETKDWLNDLEE
jgi:chaperonin GroEL